MPTAAQTAYFMGPTATNSYYSFGMDATIDFAIHEAPTESTQPMWVMHTNMPTHQAKDIYNKHMND